MITYYTSNRKEVAHAKAKSQKVTKIIRMTDIERGEGGAGGMRANV
jgi:hypothetical protein